MGFAAEDSRRVGADALVGVGYLHIRRLADDDGAGHRGFRGDDINHPTDTQTADFLVLGKRQMDGTGKIAFGNNRHHSEDTCDKALNVGGAAAVEPAVPFRHVERIARQFLSIDGHRVRMPRQNDAAFDIASDGDEQVRFVTVVGFDDPVGRGLGRTDTPRCSLSSACWNCATLYQTRSGRTGLTQRYRHLSPSTAPEPGGEQHQHSEELQPAKQHAGRQHPFRTVRQS